MGIQSVNTEDMNRRISSLLQQIDEQSVACANSPTLPNIYFLFSLLDQVYCNTNYLFSAKNRVFINFQKECFFKIYNDILMRNADEEQEPGITPMEGMLMLSYLKKINNSIIIGLQKHGYFFAQDEVQVDEDANTDYMDIADFYKDEKQKRE